MRLVLNSTRLPLAIFSEDGDSVTIAANSQSTIEDKFSNAQLPEGLMFADLDGTPAVKVEDANNTASNTVTGEVSHEELPDVVTDTRNADRNSDRNNQNRRR